MISYEQIQLMGHIVQLERKYIKQHGALFHNFAYRETSTVFVLQQTLEPSAECVPGRHGVDAHAPDSQLSAIELKSANLPVTVHLKPDNTRFKGTLGRGHTLNHSSLVGKFDKMQSEERYERVKQYDAFAFSIYANGHLPEVVFYIKNPTGVRKIQDMIFEKRQDILQHTDTSSFKATTVDIKYSDVFNMLNDDELNIIVDHSYINIEEDMIQYTQITKDQYNTLIVGSEIPKGNFRIK